jgi:hypothetical protein
MCAARLLMSLVSRSAGPTRRPSSNPITLPTSAPTVTTAHWIRNSGTELTVAEAITRAA